MPDSLRRNGEYTSAAAGGYAALPANILQRIFVGLQALHERPAARTTCTAWAAALADHALALEVVTPADALMGNREPVSQTIRPARRTFTSLASAVAQALPGETILMSKGEHDVITDLVIDKPLQILGFRRSRRTHAKRSRLELQSALEMAQQNYRLAAAAAKKSRAKRVLQQVQEAEAAVQAAQTAMHLRAQQRGRRAAADGSAIGAKGCVEARVQGLIDELQRQQQANDTTIRVMGSIHWMASFGRIKHCTICNCSSRNFTVLRVGWNKISRERKDFSAGNSHSETGSELDTTSESGSESEASDSESSAVDENGIATALSSEQQIGAVRGRTDLAATDGMTNGSRDVETKDYKPGDADGSRDSTESSWNFTRSSHIKLSLVACSIGLMNPRSAREQSRRTGRASALVIVDGAASGRHFGSDTPWTTVYMLRCSLAGSTSHGVSMIGRGSVVALRKCLVRGNGACGVQCLAGIGNRGARLRIGSTVIQGNGGPAVRVFDAENFAGAVGPDTYFVGNRTRNRAEIINLRDGATRRAQGTVMELDSNGWDLGSSFQHRVCLVDEAVPIDSVSSRATSIDDEHTGVHDFENGPLKRTRLEQPNSTTPNNSAVDAGGAHDAVDAERATERATAVKTTGRAGIGCLWASRISASKPRVGQVGQPAVHIYGTGFDLPAPRGPKSAQRASRGDAVRKRRLTEVRV